MRMILVMVFVVVVAGHVSMCLHVGLHAIQNRRDLRRESFAKGMTGTGIRVLIVMGGGTAGGTGEDVAKWKRWEIDAKFADGDGLCRC